ncbi:hypothetical protein WDU94_002998 [Cyamophila willieti]
MVKFDKSLRDVDSSLKNQIAKMCPLDVEGVVIKIRKDVGTFFSYTLRLAITDKEAALGWIKEFEEISLTSYRVSSTFAENTPRVVYRRNFRCIQNSYPKRNTQKPHEKHTSCRATVTTVIKEQVKKSRDKYLKRYPCEVNVNWFHNHTINYEALKYRRPDELVPIFAAYFANGHSPSSALELHKMKLQTEYADDYYKVVTDGSRCPKLVWCYHLYYKIFQKTCRDPPFDEMLGSLHRYIEEYNEKCEDTCATMSKDMTRNDIVVSICSPLSKRVLTLKSVREIMFVTSSGNSVCEKGNNKNNKNNKTRLKRNCKVIILLSPSVAGALPLGIIIATSEREVVITKGLEMLRDMLKEPDFSPKLIISDDSEVERNSLKKMFPISAVLLCKSNVLQTVWRFLSDTKNNAFQDKPNIFKHFTTLLHSKTKELFDENFSKLMNLESVRNNCNLSSYFNNYYRREKEWALYARTPAMMKNKYTYKNSESSIRVLKEQILQRTKSFNIPQLVDAMTSALSSYYERRILNCVNNKAQAWETKYYMPTEKIQGLNCTKTTEMEYSVRNEKGEESLVNHEIGACTCPRSIDGTLCKHQYAVMLKFNLHCDLFVPSKDVTAKKHLYYIATGEQLIEEGVTWSAGLLLNNSQIKQEIEGHNQDVKRAQSPNLISEYETSDDEFIEHKPKEGHKKSLQRTKRKADMKQEICTEGSESEINVKNEYKKVYKNVKTKRRKKNDCEDNISDSNKKSIKKKSVKSKPLKKRKKSKDEDENNESLVEEISICEDGKTASDNIGSEGNEDGEHGIIEEVSENGRIKKVKVFLNEEEIEEIVSCPDDNDQQVLEEWFEIEEHPEIGETEKKAIINRDPDIERELLSYELKDMITLTQDNTEPAPSEKEILLSDLKEMFKVTGEKLINNYDVFKPAIQAMVGAFKNMKSETAMLAAYHAFGKDTGIYALYKSKKKSQHMSSQEVSQILHYAQNYNPITLHQPVENIQIVEGNYTYLNNVISYNMVRDNELHIHENVTL